MSTQQFGTLTRKTILSGVILFFAVVFTFQLFYMQVLEESRYENQSKSNSVKKIEKIAPRGIIYDRDMKVLVSNKPAYILQITPSEFDNSSIGLIESKLQVDSGYVQKILSARRGKSPFVPVKIMKDVPFRFVAWMEENSSYLPGVSYTVEMQRDYSFGINGSHIFGYVKEISARQYEQQKDVYSLGDYIGNSGLEKTYERYLRGEKGIKYLLVDSKQKAISQYSQGTEDKDAVKGQDIVLGIDAEVQKKAEELFSEYNGAMVAMNPKTGEIIALVSAPMYELSDFTAVTSSEKWDELNNNPERPMFNRATKSIYPPGSTYKMIAAIAALEEGIIDENTKFNCQGGYQLGDRYFNCLGTHGKINVKTALEKSCNTFFYNLILKIGLDKWAEYSRKFGFGLKSGLDIEEADGLLPDKHYYNRVLGDNGFTKGMLLNLGIGQGELGVTPMQLVRYVSLIANNGKTVRPHFVRGFYNENTNEFLSLDYEDISLNISQKTFDLVKEGMWKVVNGQGTAWSIKSDEIEIAGKTGTSQNPFGEDHAVFVGFAPFNDPEIAVAVIVENVGHGSTFAAPIAGEIIKTYLKQKSETGIPHKFMVKK